jgi:FkbM family methyltransferase
LLDGIKVSLDTAWGHASQLADLHDRAAAADARAASLTERLAAQQEEIGELRQRLTDEARILHGVPTLTFPRLGLAAAAIPDAAGVTLPAVPAPDHPLLTPPWVRVDTEIGDVLMHRDDRVMTPWTTEHRCWEPEVGAVLRERLRPGMVMVDIGANVGYQTLLGAQLVGPSGRVIALEPDPDNFALLTANIAAHGCTQVQPLRVAASTRAQWMTLWLNDLNRGDHRTVANEEANRSITVPAVPVDDLIAAEVPVSLVKIDIQGNDHEAVRSMERLLAAHHPVVIVEFWPSGMELCGVTATEVLAYYRSLGATLSVAEDPSAGGGDDDILAAIARSPVDFCNLVLDFG